MVVHITVRLFLSVLRGEGMFFGRAIWEAIVESLRPTVGLASLRCAAFRPSKPSPRAAHTLVGVRHGSSLMEISCPRFARPRVVTRMGEWLRLEAVFSQK